MSGSTAGGLSPSTVTESCSTTACSAMPCTRACPLPGESSCTRVWANQLISDGAADPGIDRATRVPRASVVRCDVLVRSGRAGGREHRRVAEAHTQFQRAVDASRHLGSTPPHAHSELVESLARYLPSCWAAGTRQSAVTSKRPETFRTTQGARSLSTVVQPGAQRRWTTVGAPVVCSAKPLDISATERPVAASDASSNSSASSCCCRMRAHDMARRRLIRADPRCGARRRHRLGGTRVGTARVGTVSCRRCRQQRRRPTGTAVARADRRRR